MVSIFQVELSHTPTPLAVLTMALVRDTLLAAGLEQLTSKPLYSKKNYNFILKIFLVLGFRV